MTPFLARLPETDRTELISLLRIEHYDDGQSVLMQDDDTDDVFFVLRGSAVAESVSSDGKTTIFRLMESGAIFGELSAIDQAPRSAGVEGKTNLEIGRLPRKQFIRLIDTNRSFRWALLEYLAEQSRSMTGRIFEFSTMLVADRVIAELIRLGEQTGDTEGRAEIVPAPRHQDIAARISTHREAVSREMSRLSKRGLISKRRGGGLSVDMEGLRAIQDECRG